MEGIKILIVDDDIVLGKVMMSALNSLGYEVHYQTSLIAVKAIVLELKPDIIVLDVEVGNRNGINIAPELKLIAPNIPILFISSHVASSEVVKALHVGGVAYIKKPFDIEELQAYIERYAPTYCAVTTQIGCFTLNANDNLLRKEEEVIKKLTFLESKLLKLLVANVNQTVSRETIEKELWGDGYSSEQSLNNYVAKLRKCLSDDKTVELITIPKVGYKLVSKQCSIGKCN